METPVEKIRFSRSSQENLLIRLIGDWRMTEVIPSTEAVRHHLGPETRRIRLNSRDLKQWDTGLISFLVKLHEFCRQKSLDFDSDDLPEGARKLLALAAAVPAKTDAHRPGDRERFLGAVGGTVLTFFHSSKETLGFVGEAAISFFDLLRGKAVMRRSDLLKYIQEAGVQALPIVSCISLLVGLIFAFIGAIQLKLFGAEIFVADLVGIAMVRVMGAIMTGIIMAGRTGAAYAAQLGTMQVNEEIDAFKTMGIQPMDFLVLPRLIALILMMPVLCLYADAMGVLGGLLVSTSLLDIGMMAYLNQTQQAVTLTYVGIGLFHSLVFGVIVALAGCLRGMQCGRSASAVGEAATSAVVSAIVGIIVATAIITFICNLLNI